MEETIFLKERIKIKDKLYGIYGSPSKFKAIKYMPSVIVPENSEYYKIGDMIILLTFDYLTTLNICVIADENTLVDITTLEEIVPDKDASYIIGEDRYYYLSKEHPLKDVAIVKDYESAYNELIKEVLKEDKSE